MGFWKKGKMFICIILLVAMLTGCNIQQVAAGNALSGKDSVERILKVSREKMQGVKSLEVKGNMKSSMGVDADFHGIYHYDKQELYMGMDALMGDMKTQQHMYLKENQAIAFLHSFGDWTKWEEEVEAGGEDWKKLKSQMDIVNFNDFTDLENFAEGQVKEVEGDIVITTQMKTNHLLSGALPQMNQGAMDMQVEGEAKITLDKKTALVKTMQIQSVMDGGRQDMSMDMTLDISHINQAPEIEFPEKGANHPPLP